MLPIAIVFTPAPVLPMFIVSAEASVPILIVPVGPEWSVRSDPVPETIVNAPLSAMLFVVKVWLPILVPVMKLATPAPVTFHVSESITTLSPSSPRFTNPSASSV